MPRDHDAAPAPLPGTEAANGAITSSRDRPGAMSRCDASRRHRCRMIYCDGRLTS